MFFSKIEEISVVDGIGIRVALFVSGCTHRCKGCFNSETWNPRFGQRFTTGTENRILKLLEPEYINGLTLTGGDPMMLENQKGLISLLKKIRETYADKKDIWCYTGYTFESDIMNDMVVHNDITKEFLSYIDVLVDGEFQIENKSTKIPFRGSTNQRLIDIPESLKKQKTCIISGVAFD